MVKKRQHYIPQFYLNNFTDKTVQPPKTPYIWVFQRGVKEPVEKGPINIAYESGYYDIELEDGSTSSVVENTLSSLETIGARTLTRV